MIVSYYLNIPEPPIAFARTEAVSGTHTACVGVMEQLAKNNPADQFYVCAGPHSTVSPFHGNLTYLSASSGVPENTDVLIVSTQSGCSSIIDRLPRLRRVVYVSHTIFYLGNDDFEREVMDLCRRGIDIPIVYLCEWTRSHFMFYMSPRIKEAFRSKEHVIGNPLISDVLPPISVIKSHKRRAPRSFLWAATWERGGDVALRVFRKIRRVYPDATFHIASYYPIESLDRAEEGIVFHGKLGKAKLYDLMSRTETFLYPLVLPDGTIHKDTFGCCVSEALACGCRVITYAQGTLEELFGRYEKDVVFVPVPDEVAEFVRSPVFYQNHPWLLTEEAVDNFANVALLSINGVGRHQIGTAVDVRKRFSDHEINPQWNLVISPKDHCPSSFTLSKKVTYYLDLTIGNKLSGTHASRSIVVDKLSYDVVVCDSRADIPEDTETLILSTQFRFPGDPTKFPSLKHVVYVTHMNYMFPYTYEIPLLLNAGYNVSVVFLCEWVRKMVRYHLEHPGGLFFSPPCPEQAAEYERMCEVSLSALDARVSQHVIGNPLEDTIPPVERCMQHREPHTYVYSATWDRGGDIALRVFRKIRDSVFPERATLHIASYHDSIPPEVANETGVIVHGSLDKNELYELLVSTETMLYPSFSATGSIHRDTFSCTVCEAIACGCRVISYAHGALAELYSGIVEFVEVPREHQASLDSFYYLEDPWFATDEAIDGFARMASMKEGTRDEYITLIRDRYSAKRIGAEWSNLLSGGRNA